ncbi:heme biosynthesis protein HemY [Noviherbaspirillum malthae]|jgi:HemY protein|uniref:heme biosynthesis protein HemY n=1 Tax=Noviherbaspirillum malthae TaxID=1260987 RepID=UPI00188ECFC4|nr:heme biosynthesis protein HemY [Noviherbaspirillum malthae]
MRIFITIVILFAVAIGLAVGARFNPGNVVFFYPPYRIDMSLNLFLALALALFAVLYTIMNAIRSTQQMPQRVAAYRREKREREGNRALRDALKSLFEGRFGHAEKAAMRAAESEENAGLSALIAARAAHRMSQTDRRDAWLSRTQDPSLKTARLMTAIELSTDEHDPASALEAVRELNSSGTRHIHALRLALKANQRAKDWPEVLRLVRLLDKRNALHPALSRRLRELAYEDLLSTQAHDAESIRRVWSGIPAEDRVQPYVAVRAAKAFNAKGLHDEARGVVEKALAVDWDERLVRAYGESAAAEGSAALLTQIEHCEQWSKAHPTDPELALTLGTLCLRQKLWGKAQRHLEQALSQASDMETVRQAHLKLAQLHEALNQPDEAASHYRQCALVTML